ncbi:hypothetical protein D3C71_1705880 [compost metagenome]
MQEYRFPLQPTRGERADAADFLRLLLQADGGFVHAELLVVQAAASHRAVNTLRFLLAFRKLQPMHRPFQKRRKRFGAEPAHRYYRKTVRADNRPSIAAL